MLNMPPLVFESRRSDVRTTHGAAASSQPLASEIGLRILRAGGNAADAAVAMAAALNVTEPCSTGEYEEDVCVCACVCVCVCVCQWGCWCGFAHMCARMSVVRSL